ncbi:MAG: cytidine deaminase [Deltaproteobacteria bacterium]|nr:cytidine deaminase [Deltaproteobacteria bacterium]
MSDVKTGSEIDWEALTRAASEARDQAYAPYSRFRVGAALQCADGRVFTGVNVENASYGLCLCAERSAVAAAVTAGARDFEALVVIAPGSEATSPCGMCRQVLHEFAPELPIQARGAEGGLLVTSAGELLPHAFRAEDLAERRD